MMLLKSLRMSWIKELRVEESSGSGKTAKTNLRCCRRTKKGSEKNCESEVAKAEAALAEALTFLKVQKKPKRRRKKRAAARERRCLIWRKLAQMPC